MEDKENKAVDTTKKKTTRRRTVKTEEVEIKKEEPIIKEIIVEKKSGFNYAEVIVIMIIMLIVGGITGSFITYLTKGKANTNKCINNIVKSDIPDEMNEFLDAYNNIINDYYEEVDHKALLEAGINGMLEYLDDDYSMYMDQEESQSFNEQVEGKYTGIGVEIVLETTGEVVINRVFEGSPAAKAGMLKNDVILKVDDTVIDKKNASEVATLIRKSGKSKVDVTVKRDEEEIIFSLELDVVDIESIVTKTFESNDKKIGYIEISIFASNTYNQFKKALENLEKDGIDSLIIDVRGNSGGYLTTVTDIASLFLNKKQVIYQLDTKGIVEKVYSKTKESRDYDVVVLADRGSASASEILAGALQESYGAKVIGTNTFGKGTVQAAYSLSSGSIVKYTIQKWLTPNGNWINEKGITPDIEVYLTEEYAKNPCDETDNQLQTAISELSK